ncbi:MAG: phosphotransferase [Gammaproteobacteria bacterium]|nr:phosphotransferase [Gammaproteobacteria bacterium]
MLLGHDRTNRLLVLEDLGRAGDFTSAYTARYITRDACVELERYLDLLHGLPVDGSRFQNMAMRSLNHEHSSVIPFSQANGLDLDAYTPGLASLGRAVADDTRIRHAAQDLGQIDLGRTLAGTPALLHGDFFPGSWLVGNDPAIRVIDPEFCFHGPQEFDLGVFIAHRLFIGESAESATAFLQNRSVDQPLTRAFAGIELMRRLLGVAQLPLDRSLDEKGELVNIGQTWLKAWFK